RRSSDLGLGRALDHARDAEERHLRRSGTDAASSRWAALSEADEAANVGRPVDAVPRTLERDLLSSRLAREVAEEHAAVLRGNEDGGGLGGLLLGGHGVSPFIGLPIIGAGRPSPADALARVSAT